MKEIVRIRLDNEMDLILAHKRAMKLAEMCGLITSSQTRFATAVSEIARCAISNGENSYLILGIDFLSGGKKQISAIIYDNINLASSNPEAYAYAGRLSKSIEIEFINGIYEICLTLPVPFSGIITQPRINYFIEYFQKETPLSPYDEIRKKNIQLIELSEKLIESEGSYRQLTDTLPLIVFSVTTTGTISLANKKLVEIFGSHFNNFTAATFPQLFHEDDIIAMTAGWEGAKRKKQQFTGQARVNFKGFYLWNLISIVPNKDDKGDVLGWIISMVDINAQKLIEETLIDNKELRQAQERLEVSNHELHVKNLELEQFAYIASHDLQEPLRKIRNFISLAERTLDEQERERLYFAKINNSVERMSRLIKDVLSYSRLSVRTEEFSLIDLNTVMLDVIADFEFLIEEKEAKIRVNDLPSIKGIPVQIGQLFYNLVGNSLKFSDSKPQITVSAETVTKANAAGKKNAFYRISVADNGIGIEQQHLLKIFTIFKRLHPQNEYEGTGIGLALCKKIAENHEGFIEIDSVPDKGTTVAVYLPSM